MVKKMRTTNLNSRRQSSEFRIPCLLTNGLGTMGDRGNPQSFADGDLILVGVWEAKEFDAVDVVSVEGQTPHGPQGRIQ